MRHALAPGCAPSAPDAAPCRLVRRPERACVAQGPPATRGHCCGPPAAVPARAAGDCPGEPAAAPACAPGSGRRGALGRRESLLLLLAAETARHARPARAFAPPPPGYSLIKDKLDGYSFLLPDSWTPLSSSGNDVFYRNPYNVNENLFVNISSPSSSRYASVDDLRSPQAAAERTKAQYFQELMSTRLGVKRSAEILGAAERIGPDGRKYYDLELEAKSFASRNQLAVSQRQIDAAMELEWHRRYLTVLGVANRRLYEFRLQTSADTWDQAKDTLKFIAESFRCTEVEA